MIKSNLSVQETQDAIKLIRDKFQKEIAVQLNLVRISAPLFLQKNSGLNDDLNGTQEPVSFTMNEIEDEIQVIHSLAKWKRYALKKYDYAMHSGIYTNMNAIRKDEKLDFLHSAYVDQWDWEYIIQKEERTIQTLQDFVRKIVKVIKHIEHEVWYAYPHIKNIVSDEVYFISSQKLLELYPNLSAKERENAITKEKGCVFVMQIGKKLSDHSIHDGRACDYDDWELNGDLLYYFKPQDCAIEISSMGIRVDEQTLQKQCIDSNNEDRLKLPYHQAILNKELPYTIGGGIGQSRLCMLLLNKEHIAQVQASIWPQSLLKELEDKNIEVL